MRRALPLALVLLMGMPALASPSADPHVLLVYPAPIQLSWREALEGRGIVVHEYVHPNAYLVHAGTGDIVTLPGDPTSSSLPLAGKLSPLLQGLDPVPAWVLLYPDVSADRAERMAREMDGAARMTRLPTGESVLAGTFPAKALVHLASDPSVRWIEPSPTQAGFDNARASILVQSGMESAWPMHEAGINGSSQTVGFCDSGLDTNAPLALAVGQTTHELFRDTIPLLQNLPSQAHRKVILYYAPVDGQGLRGDLDDADGHGTHVAGTLAGDAGVLGARDSWDGIAFGAKLAVCDAGRGRAFQILDDYSAYWAPAYKAGARVHSNSWGTTLTNEYTLVARQHDAYAWAHQDFLILRSVGNAGPNGPMRAEAVAKNVLAVGATSNDASATLQDYSARGPASDGRAKPDLLAPGECVTSADIAGPTAYACLGGTSQATAAAAGAATLVRDYYAKGYAPSGTPNPATRIEASAALVRATLLASAAPRVDDVWGQVNLTRALAIPGSGIWTLPFQGSALETSQEWSTTVALDVSGPLRVVLAWSDAPASPGASRALVNDLDLEVQTPQGTTLFGNGGTPDRLNNAERVLLEAAEPGTYTVTVRGFNVPWGPQPFAVVIVAAS